MCYYGSDALGMIWTSRVKTGDGVVTEWWGVGAQPARVFTGLSAITQTQRVSQKIPGLHKQIFLFRNRTISTTSRDPIIRREPRVQGGYGSQSRDVAGLHYRPLGGLRRICVCLR